MIHYPSIGEKVSGGLTFPTFSWDAVSEPQDSLLMNLGQDIHIYQEK